MSENIDIVDKPKNISNLKDAISALDEVGKLSTYTVRVPSVPEELTFRELNAKQQKQLLQSIVDSPFYKTRFITAIYDILKENFVVTSGNVKFDDLTILDKQIIILKTRINCFSSKFEVTEENQTPTIIDLDDLYEKAQQISSPEGQSISIDGIPVTIDVSIPTIRNEYDLEQQLHKTIEVTDVNDPETLRETLGNMFVGEISKYITTLTINGAEVHFGPMRFKDRIQILEKLPNKLIQKVVEYIDGVKKTINGVVTEKIDVDGSFLTIK